MQKDKAYTTDYSMQVFQQTLQQWLYNTAELSRKCKSNQKVMDMLQSLSEAIDSINDWSDLPGSIMLVVAYQPGLFDEDRFDGKGDWQP